jgi:UDP-glucose 4-epimerase
MILVTGGAGYIGSQFVRYYTRCRPTEKVVVLDNLVEGHLEALDGLSNVHFERADIGDFENVKNILSKHRIDAVVHFASYCYVGESQENPSKYYQNNVAGSISLFRAMEECQVGKLVFSSSCATYGVPVQELINEEHPQNPINVYGLTKLLIEKILTGYADTKDWSFTALRYFNAAGADKSGLVGESHDPETHIIPLALKTALGTKEVLQIFGDDYDTPDGSCIRDYIHVEDLARAHLLALDKLPSQKGGQFINLGTAYGASVKEIVDVCEQVSGKKINHTFSPRRSGDPARLIADASKAASYLGWKPQHDLRSIVETAWMWETKKRY